MSATVAAALHALVLFGFEGRQPPARTRATPPETPPFVSVVSTKDDDPPPELSTEPAIRPKGSPDALRPTLDEPAPRPSAFEQPSRPAPPLPISPVPTLTKDPFGDFEGQDEPGSLATPGVFTLDHLDNTPRTRSQTPPAYPFEARSAGLSGEVVVRFVVDESGRVQQARVVRSTHALFEAASLRAVQQWRFEPGKKGGRPVRFQMTVPVVFNLDT